MATIETWALHRIDPVLMGKLDLQQSFGLEYSLAPNYPSVETTNGIEAESFSALRILPWFAVSMTLGFTLDYEANNP